MTAIERADLEAGEIDLSEVVDPDPERLAPVSPGQVLQAEFLEPLRLSAGAVARAIGVPRNRLTGILNGRRAITADTALRLGHLLPDDSPAVGCLPRASHKRFQLGPFRAVARPMLPPFETTTRRAR